MILTKVITGKLPGDDLLKAYDFTLPDSDWIPVNENVDDEIVEIHLEVARVIRECVENN